MFSLQTAEHQKGPGWEAVLSWSRWILPEVTQENHSYGGLTTILNIQPIWERDVWIYLWAFCWTESDTKLRDSAIITAHADNAVVGGQQQTLTLYQSSCFRSAHHKYGYSCCHPQSLCLFFILILKLREGLKVDEDCKCSISYRHWVLSLICILLSSKALILNQILNFYCTWPICCHRTLCIASVRTIQHGSREQLLWSGYAPFQQVKTTKQVAEQWWNKLNVFNNGICHQCLLVFKEQ